MASSPLPAGPHAGGCQSLKRSRQTFLSNLPTLVFGAASRNTTAAIHEMRREMRSSGTLPRDSIHLAVMKRLGLPAIVSDDEGFDQRPSIDLFMP
jgi:predicted nucleic acid-binding protein